MPKTNAQLVNQNSGKMDYHTPPEILESVRQVLGYIDLDPFSSRAANKQVKAVKFFTTKDDGLKQDWHGRVWMNMPFSKINNPRCVNKLIQEYQIGHVKEALCITFASTSEKWFQPLLAYPQCFLAPRTNYYLPDGTKAKGVTKGSVVTYLGRRVDVFVREFARHGVIKVAYDQHPVC